MRTTGKYYGDEIKSYNTVTSDFYEYFEVTKSDVAKYTGEKVETIKYYKKYNGSSTKIDSVFKSIGVPEKYRGSWIKRKQIAKKNGIAVYIGSSSQNTKIITLAKQGKLDKV